MQKIVEVKPMGKYTVWLKFADGVQGTVDLSELAGKGVFAKWDDADFFNSVFIDNETRTIAWPGGIDLCPDNLYATMAGVDPLKLPQNVKSAIR